MAKFVPDREKRKLSISIHPAAKSAFEFFNNQAFLFNKTLFTVDTLRRLNQYSTLHVVRQERGKVLLFSGFEYFGFDLSHTDLRKCTVINHQDLTHDDIQLRAWINVTRAFLSSLQPQKIESFRENFNQSAPNDLVRILCNKNKISQPQLAKWTSLSRSGIARQKSQKSTNNNCAPQSSPSIFDMLIRESMDEQKRD